MAWEYFARQKRADLRRTCHFVLVHRSSVRDLGTISSLGAHRSADVLRTSLYAAKREWCPPVWNVVSRGEPAQFIRLPCAPAFILSGPFDQRGFAVVPGSPYVRRVRLLLTTASCLHAQPRLKFVAVDKLPDRPALTASHFVCVDSLRGKRVRSTGVLDRHHSSGVLYSRTNSSTMFRSRTSACV